MPTSRKANLAPQSIYPDQLFRSSTVATTIRQNFVASETAGGTSTESHVRVLVATTGNHGLSGLSAIDGVTPVAGDRVLAWMQSTPSQNGLYVAASGAWARADDAIVASMLVAVRKGTAYDNALFMCSNDDDPNVGVDAITFVLKGNVTGSGTATKLARWSDSDTLDDSLLTDTGSVVQLGTSSTACLLNVESTATNAYAVGIVNSAATGTGGALAVSASNATGNAFDVTATGGARGVDISMGGGGSAIRAQAVSGFAGEFYGGTGAIDAAVLIDQQSTSGAGGLRVNTNTTGEKIIHVTGQYQERFSVDYDGHAKIIASDGGHPLFIEHLADGELMRLDQDGNVSIGTAATPTARLDVSVSSATIHGAVINQASTADVLVLKDGGTTVWRLKDGGTVHSTGCGEVQALRTVSAATTLAANDRILCVDTTTATGNVVVTLPNPPVAGQRYTIIDVGDNGGTNRVILSPGTGVSIDVTAANTNKGVILNNGESVEVIAVSTTLWWTLLTPRVP